MIITRTPLRISLGGGGSDLPSYYRRHGGFVISAAIDRYVYVGINRTFTADYLVKYSTMERTSSVDEIDHPIVREALRLHPVGPSLEIVSLADIPSGTGLGSSGSFTVGLLRVLYALEREHVAAGALAEEACRIEIDVLGRPVGKQDQYISAFGGLRCFELQPDGRVHVSTLGVSTATLHELEERLLMFFTGYARDAAVVLADQERRTLGGDEDLLHNLKEVKQVGYQIRDALENGDTRAFAALMDEHWQRKRRRSALVSSPAIDHWYEVGRANGALGGKLVGAGAGGFLLFYAEDPAALRSAMAEACLTEVRFAFDHDGAVVLVRG